LLRPTVQENLKAIPSGQSTIIRNRAARNQLRSQLDDGIEQFYHIYAESVRNLGTPVYSLKYFTALKETFSENSDIVTVIHGKHAVASSLNIYFRDEVMTLYVGGTAVARPLGANVFMFWEVMRRACERGYRLFDFGRSKVGTGAFTFKRNWGFEPTRLAYQYKLLEGCEIPDHNPLNPKYRLLIAAWKRLPVPVANLLGPPIVKGLG
jgi:FemAB-related protein (PEP-CTERM system-associated)